MHQGLADPQQRVSAVQEADHGRGHQATEKGAVKERSERVIEY
jgi:hypothetical protein